MVDWHAGGKASEGMSKRLLKGKRENRNKDSEPGIAEEGGRLLARRQLSVGRTLEEIRATHRLAKVALLEAFAVRQAGGLRLDVL